VCQTDLNDDWKNNKNLLEEMSIKKGSVPLIVCHFALHYLVSNEKDMKNIIELISYFLQPNGEFVFTILDKDAVNNVTKKDNKWEVKLRSTPLYSIYKKSKNEIEILLPFDKKPRKEYLINIIDLDKEFNKHNITRIEEQKFNYYLSNFEKERPHFYNELSNDDKIYISLYKYIIYKKIL
jgi:hypothetical protein